MLVRFRLWLARLVLPSGLTVSQVAYLTGLPVLDALDLADMALTAQMVARTEVRKDA